MHEQAADLAVLQLIERLAAVEDIRGAFYLAGGTALALQLGHRKSNDLDLFAPKPFDIERLSRRVVALGGTVLVAEQGTLHATIDGVKASFFYYPYGLLKPFVLYRGLNIAAIEDIACMKVIAISQRGEKKDFFDLVEILKSHQPHQLKELFLSKYGDRRVNCYHILKSLFYFVDADQSPDPVSLNETTWDQVKAQILNRRKELTQALCPMELNL